MSQAVTNFAYLDTRISVLSGQLLHHRQRSRLLEQPLSAIGALLTQAGVLAPSASLPPTPEALEQQLATLLIDESRILGRGMNSAGRRFVEHWMRRFELINLKLILRARFAHRCREEIQPLLLDLGQLGTLPLQSLMNTESVAEFLRQLQTTRYSIMAWQARKAFEEQRSLFDVEAILDVHYHHQLMQLAREIPGSQQQPVLRLLRTWLDQINLVALLRFRLTYGLSPPHCYFLLAPPGRRLSAQILQQLAQQSSLKAVVDALPQALRGELPDIHSIDDAENRMVQRTRRSANKILHDQHFEMARAFAYLYLREQQLQLLHTVMKGHMLGLSQELIRSCGAPLDPPAGHAERP